MPKGPAKAATPVAPRVRRGYFESRYGQLHVHNAIPPGGGFDEGTSLICLHATPRSGSSLLPLLGLMGMDRSVYAPDLPGYGNSDPPPARPAIADYAAAVGDFCTTMRFRQVDVLGYQTGALVAAELALALPSVVRRVVLMGVPVPDIAERENFRRAPWPIAPAADGSHLPVEWERSRNAVHEGCAAGDPRAQFRREARQRAAGLVGYARGDAVPRGRAPAPDHTTDTADPLARRARHGQHPRTRPAAEGAGGGAG
jgi:pimeloyl-ACP methyl ester carboxylesterase